MDYKCEFCGKILHTPAGLTRHITIKHRQPTGQTLEVNNRLAALEKATKANTKGIIGVIVAISDHLSSISKEIEVEAKSSYSRDQSLLEEVKTTWRDAAEQTEGLLEVIGGIQSNEAKMLKALEDIATILGPKPIKMRSKDEARL